MTAFPAFLHPIAGLVDQGGPIVAILLGLSLVAVALIIAKGLQFAAAGVGRHGQAQKALDLWQRGDLSGAQAAVDGSRSVMSGVMGKLVRAESIDASETKALREDIERVCNVEINKLRAYLRPLDMIAQTAPLIGLLGTVLGMIEAFQAMQGAGAAVDPSVLAGGIWVALMTTAVGLAVAIPVSAIVGWFDGRIEAEQAEMEALVTAFFTGAIADRGVPRVVAMQAGDRRHAV
ncbi:MotA/TolQ/ExbB proton channel family protein [Roseibium sp. RKSG952]|uniref:MotA/TolQ/ExbB proton channel family protein n=1 Tax=Roseibium sp. RKSG952 TaxID=2529384 RepID=UPI0012BBABBF|nr:MotA/TolQ/ExbB proton channel family protein [Roseibium sp. RKSG952]MTH99991.1 MotA/TolQ/ExbB proton channel family protein [Roseibium sp. RKSG952]